MGRELWLDCIAPDKWSDALGILRLTPPENLDQAIRFLARFGRDSEPREYLLYMFKSGTSHQLTPDGVNYLAETAAADRQWDFRGLLVTYQALPDWLPALAPLSAILQFEGVDVPTPGWCLGDGGLRGCVSHASYCKCLDVIDFYSSPQEIAKDLRTATARAKRSLWSTIPREVLVAGLEEDDGATWGMLKEALAYTAQRKHYLGLGLSA